MFTSSLFAPILKWIGEQIGSTGRLEIFQSGSGDTTMAYMSLILLAVTSVAGTILWSILDRKRPSYNQLFYWFTVILRIFLVFFMFTYGFVKIFKVQFPGPSLTSLLQPIGNLSPMGLAWTYMGHSEGFNMFVGGFGSFRWFVSYTQTHPDIGSIYYHWSYDSGRNDEFLL